MLLPLLNFQHILWSPLDTGSRFSYWGSIDLVSLNNSNYLQHQQIGWNSTLYGFPGLRSYLVRACYGLLSRLHCLSPVDIYDNADILLSPECYLHRLTYKQTPWNADTSLFRKADTWHYYIAHYACILYSTCSFAIVWIDSAGCRFQQALEHQKLSRQYPCTNKVC